MVIHAVIVGMFILAAILVGPDLSMAPNVGGNDEIAGPDYDDEASRDPDWIVQDPAADHPAGQDGGDGGEGPGADNDGNVG